MGKQADDLHCDIEMEIKCHADIVTKPALVAKVDGWAGFPLSKEGGGDPNCEENATEQEMLLGREMEELKTQLNVQLSVSSEFSVRLKAEREDNQPPKEVSQEECEEQQGDKSENEPALRN